MALINQKAVDTRPDTDDSSSILGHNPFAVRQDPFRPASVKGRVMIVFMSYRQYGPGLLSIGEIPDTADGRDCMCPKCSENEPLAAILRRHFDTTDKNSTWGDERYEMCAPRVVGYALREKQWAQFLVAPVKKIEEQGKNGPNAFDKVRLAQRKTKNLLLELVDNHAKGDPQSGNQIRDIVENKGNSLVILLYGPPGVGKTSTAETIALTVNKPLFSIGVSDVGTRAQNVEANLEKVFDLATTWEAILLIDEADVFLNSRSTGLVFLRVLEYYQGILFLTTNQIAQFDVAVQSRIHVAIKYDRLNDEQTRAIFQHFLQQLADNGKVERIDDITEWIEDEVIARHYNFDGRQIRNVFSCAMTLARAQDEKLTKASLIRVVDKVRDFRDDLRSQFERYMNSQAGRDPHNP